MINSYLNSYFNVKDYSIGGYKENEKQIDKLLELYSNRYIQFDGNSFKS